MIMDMFRRNARSDLNNGIHLSNTKANVKAKLIESIKDLQIEYAEGNPAAPIETNELTYSLVTVLEAIFIHGLKGTSGHRVLVKSTNARNLPQPCFWPFVLVFSHKETINHLDGLKALSTDIGRSRAWIRLALNDCLLGSYLVAMVNDKATLRRHYLRQSILRDADLMDILIRYLRGIEIYRFDIALNSGLLNRWATGPLVLAGICMSESGEVSATTPSNAIDAAAMVATETGTDPLDDATTSSISGLATTSPSGASNNDAFEVIARPAGYLNRGLLNEDEALKLILAGVSPVTFSGSSSNAESPMGSPPSQRRKQSKEPSPLVSQIVEPKIEALPLAAAAAVADVVDVEADFRPLNSLSDEGMETTMESSEEIETSSEEQQILQVHDKAQREVVEGEERLEGDDDDEDDELEIDIYHRRSPRENSTSCSSIEARNEEDHADHPEILNNLSDHLQPEAENCDEDSNTILICKSDTDSKTKSLVNKRTNFGLSSSKSSTSTGSGSITLASVPYLAGFIDSWLPFASGLRYFDTPPTPQGNGDQSPNEMVQCGFSLKPHVQVGLLSEDDSQQLMVIFDKVVQEEGLSLQNFECADCTKAIGTIFGPAKICSYTKRYYCQECHLDEMATIPAKIMYNWDFRAYKVCHKAKIFLSSVGIEPIIDVKSFNSELHYLAPNLQEIFDLRRKLRYMNAYLSTCKNGNSQEKHQFDKMLWPRTYLYEDVDVYAIRDLEEIHSGKLPALLNSVFNFALKHITKCLLCSGKGFICEICKEDQVLFPFEFDSIMSCKNCFTVFHLDCSVQITSCPKCDRIEARNLNWHVSLSKIQRQQPNL